MQRLKLGSTVRNLIVDTAIFAGFLLATDPHATGQTIHEWLGLAFGAGILTHLLLHWKWIVSTIKRYVWQPLQKTSGIPSRGAARNLGLAQEIPHFVRNDISAPVRKQGGVR
jgi:hypothetical protein